jgi:hypothetical protein
VVIEVPLQDDGGSVFIEVGADAPLQTDSIESFEKILENVKQTAAGFLKALKEIQPDSVSLEFGIKFTYEAGKLLALIGKTGTEASCNVKLNWESEKSAK